MSVADVLEGKHVCICAGSGGVGKTTVSAAVAAGLERLDAGMATLT